MLTDHVIILLRLIILDFILVYSKLKTKETTDRELLEKDSVCKLLTLNVWLVDYYLIRLN